MSKPLGFKVQGRKPEVKAIGDEMIGILEVAQHNCLTVEEEITWSDYFKNLEDDKSISRIKFDIVTAMLWHRYDEEISTEDIRQALRCRDFRLVELLYEFFEGERYRNPPKSQLLRVDGEGAKEIAIDYAKTHKAVVVSRPDFAAAEIYFVLRSAADRADGFDVIADHSNEVVEIAEIVVGKSKAKSNGTSSTGAAA